MNIYIMRKILLMMMLGGLCSSIQSQTLTTTKITDWNTIRKSGFYESSTVDSKNLPNTNHTWYWGINMSHSLNAVNTDKPYYFGGQILLGINGNSSGLPLMYIRSTNGDGLGTWAKVLTDRGTQTIYNDLNIYTLNCTNTADAKLKSVLGRLAEGNDEGEGTFLGVRSHLTQPAYTKSFSIEHKFFGNLNSSINFYRGGSKIGGYIGIGVYDGREIAKFHIGGLNLGGTLSAREVKIEITAGADHVFNNDYELKPLSEVEAFVKKNKHLPEIQSEKQMQDDGLNINEFQIKLLQKIEELTLYVIEQDKTIKNQNSLLTKQSKLIEDMQVQINEMK